ncbi:rhodanese-like domain-containing protein [Asticcacaulis excentricus]|uniref:Rhodanese domain protein n=1 Tax=Asticcacaulis excentricus (strain ATCC 15261 / DSM 4724 / KCTC 12464 / NCIMB 9791 / VKM B-1370 / CB 48) TaxID=573065 RepID=E8RRE6_ASTEC|nr:rhodanese-like domain-containing protein [Asticcacaulis excentricus]ADU12337.1 Rhodanese domain protein [Asticcacaulis excentricus CB 48]
MFGLFQPLPSITNLTPAEVHRGLQTKTLLLIDVREPSEFSAEHIKGAINLPLSSLSSEALATVTAGAGERTVVMQCLAGGRSAQGVKACRSFGAQVDHHLQGGLNAWKAAGLPTVR